jgi:hypothetical protein
MSFLSTRLRDSQAADLPLPDNVVPFVRRARDGGASGAPAAPAFAFGREPLYVSPPSGEAGGLTPIGLPGETARDRDRKVRAEQQRRAQQIADDLRRGRGDLYHYSP